MPAASTEQRLAARLAAPFTRPSSSRSPLSFRMLPEGGMVVITADGRKLWFTLDEVNAAREELGLPQINPPPKPVEKKVESFGYPEVSSRPPPRMREGQSEMIVLPPELKFLEQKINDKTRRP